MVSILNSPIRFANKLPFKTVILAKQINYHRIVSDIQIKLGPSAKTNVNACIMQPEMMSFPLLLSYFMQSI